MRKKVIIVDALKIITYIKSNRDIIYDFYKRSQIIE